MASKKCGAPLEEHVSDLVNAMGQTALGGACVDTYHALLELAEFLRVTHGFEEGYEPRLTDRLTRVTSQPQKKEMWH